MQTTCFGGIGAIDDLGKSILFFFCRGCLLGVGGADSNSMGDSNVVVNQKVAPVLPNSFLRIKVVPPTAMGC